MQILLAVRHCLRDLELRLTHMFFNYYNIAIVLQECDTFKAIKVNVYSNDPLRDNTCSEQCEGASSNKLKIFIDRGKRKLRSFSGMNGLL